MPDLLTDPAHLTGYTPKLSYAPGESVALHLSAAEPIQVRLVKLHSSDPFSGAVRSEPITGLVTAAIPGIQSLKAGSYGTATVHAEAQFTAGMWVYPTHAEPRDCSLLTLSRNGQTLSLSLDHDGQLSLGHGPGSLVFTPLGLGRLTRHKWVRVQIAIAVHAVRVRVETTQGDGLEVSTDLVFGGSAGPVTVTLAAFEGTRFFDGKIDDVIIDGAALEFDPLQVSPEIRSRGAVCGELMNSPTRAVTGHLWRDQTQLWQTAPELYSAAHFHSDDLDNACWPITTELVLPLQLASGFYAAEVSTATHRDWLPFAVRAPKRAVVTVLLPSFTWLAYANEAPFAPHEPVVVHPRDDFARESGLVSLYNFHTDGSGVALASLWRPLLNLRPDYRYWLTGYPHGPGADLSILDFVEHLGLDYDVITDHDLDADPSLLDDCTILVTGCHPEYWSRPMMGVLEAWQNAGGRFVYLGGNGLHAVVAPLPGAEHVLELRRRGAEVGLWEAEPGEAGMASTGELGGLWKHHHPAPSSLTGMSYCTMGFAAGVGFRALPGAHDQRVGFITAGLSPDEISGATIFGDRGLWFGAAAAYECDRAATGSGLPGHAIILAQSEPLPSCYESSDSSGLKQANLIFFETDAHGAVFSVGSISWAGALAIDGYDNAVATITANVLRRFASPARFGLPSK